MASPLEAQLNNPPAPSPTASNIPADAGSALDDSSLPLTIETVSSRLLDLPPRDALAASSALIRSRRIGDVDVARAAIEAGLARCETELRQVEEQVRAAVGDEDGGAPESARLAEEMKKISRDDGTAPLLQHGAFLAQARRKVETFELFAPKRKPQSDQADAGSSGSSDDVVDPLTEAAPGGEEMEMDDPWAETEEIENVPVVVEDPWDAGSTSDKSDHPANERPKAEIEVDPTPEPDEAPVSISDFLADHIIISAMYLASCSAIPALRIVLERHAPQLHPYRFGILESFSPWVSPSDLKDLQILPGSGEDGTETLWPASWDRNDDFREAMLAVVPLPDVLPERQEGRLSAQQLSEWYTARIESIDSLGQLDAQLALVQHGASLGIPSLDSLGEDLSLLSRLVYDASLPSTALPSWTLAHWRSSTPTQIISAYLLGSTPDTIVSDIRRLILPYLYVLESRAERSGDPDPHLIDRELHDAILSLPLNVAIPIFESSKATLPATQRLIKNDVTVARLALACLYGSDERSAWPTMSAIFECLPVWDVSGGDPESDKEATATTLDSIATFIRPTKAGQPPAKAKDVYLFFSPLPFASLSRALDILDVHLESGEILARWDTPVQLRFLLQSARDEGEQKDLAERMVRREAARRSGEDRWERLWGDIRKLAGGGDSLLRGAFGMLSEETLVGIYLGGLLTSGRFDTARRQIRKLEREGILPQKMLEEAVLEASREFYDNAESGNVHTGEMKLAYDCLGVAPLTAAIQSEREFIEATSRLTSYSLPSPRSHSASSTLTPIEIRHTATKLDLIRLLLNHSDDAWRHSELVLELTDKFGYRGDDVAAIEVRGMLVERCVRAEEWEMADEHCEEMHGLFRRVTRKGGEREKTARTVCWQSCFLLGRQSEYSETSRKMCLLGYAVELCPPETVPEVLGVWRTVENGQIKLGEASKRRRLAGIPGPAKRLPDSTVTSPAIGGPEERVLGSRTAAKAARLAMDLSGRFGLAGYSLARVASRDRSASRQGSAREGESGRTSLDEEGVEGRRPVSAALAALESEEGERVRQQARKAFVRGVGWLLGAEESEISG